jgi:hypothetical protein
MTNQMKTVDSVSGGMTSAYVAANYPSEYNVFSLVRIEDERCKFPDEKLRREVEDRIQAPFIATAEEDMIIYTMLDLEQYLGRRIDWVTGPTFEDLIRRILGGYLPNREWRKCTTQLKMIPIANWWGRTFDFEPVKMNIGYRANELSRVEKILGEVNKDGFCEIKMVVGKRGTRNKWATVAWRKAEFPCVEDDIYKIDILHYWRGKPVRFAKENNCVGCFQRSIQQLRKKFDEQPGKMRWFLEQEGGKKDTHWKSNATYKQIASMMLQTDMFDDLEVSCNEGFCEP